MPGSIGKHFPHPLNKKHIRIFRRVLPGVQPWLEESARFYAAEQPESRSGLHVPKYHQVVFQWGSTWIFWETHPENRKKTPRFNGNTSIELKHGKIKKRVVQQQKPKQVSRSYGLWCLDITYGVFFSIEFLHRFVWLSLNFQFCLPCVGYPKSDLMSAGNGKNNFGQRLHRKGVEISLGLDPNLHLPGFISLENTAQLGWFQKMSFISPLPKKN